MLLIRDLRSRFLSNSAAKTRTARPLRATDWQFQHSQGRNVYTVTFNLMPMDGTSPFERILNLYSVLASPTTSVYNQRR